MNMALALLGLLGFTAILFGLVLKELIRLSNVAMNNSNQLMGQAQRLHCLEKAQHVEQARPIDKKAQQAKNRKQLQEQG